jgi:hypothetical protein
MTYNALFRHCEARRAAALRTEGDEPISTHIASSLAKCAAKGAGLLSSRRNQHFS